MQLPRAQSWAPRISGSSPLKAWLVVCALSFLAYVSTAMGADSAIRKVSVVLVGDLGSEPTLPERITSWFDPSAYDVSIAKSERLASEDVLSPEPDGAVYVWVVLTSDREARLYFATTNQEGTPLYSVRNVSLTGGLDEIGAERLSQILHPSVVALFEGQGEQRREQVKRLLEQEPAAHPAPKPAPQQKSAAKLRAPTKPKPPAPGPHGSASRHSLVEVDAGVGYGGILRGDEGSWHGPRLGIGITLAQRWTLGLWAQGYWPHTEELNLVRLEFRGLELELGLGVRTPLASKLELLVRAGPGVEIIRYEPVSLSADVSVASGETEARPIILAQMGLGWQGDLVNSFLVVGAAYTLSHTHYDLRTSDSSLEIAEPSRFMPTANVEFRF